MNLNDFTSRFPDEESCKKYFKGIRDRQQKTCAKCGCTEFYWKNDKEMYQCKECGKRFSLRKGTVMECSKLSFREWFMAMHLLTATKQGMSIIEIQRQTGQKYYRNTMYMVHKIMDVMGQREDVYELGDEVELDEVVFSTIGKEFGKESVEEKVSVLVMAESKEPDEEERNRKEGKTPKVKKKVGYIKMRVLGDMKSQSIKEKAKESVNEDTKLVTDGSKSHSKLKGSFREHDFARLNEI